MRDTLEYRDVLTVMECGECGISFAVPERWRQEREDTGKGWYCPNGHSRVYRESTVQKLEKQVERERAARVAAQDQATAAERSVAAIKGELTKVKNRIANGVCPECHRQFQNVSRHMESKHPTLPKGLAPLLSKLEA